MESEIEHLAAKKCKILVITVSSWNSRVGSNTWLSLLESYPAELIGNICIRDEMPDNPACGNYFSISESKVLRSILKRTLETGQKNTVGKNNLSSNEYLDEHNKRYARLKTKRRYSLLLARELVWLLGRWKSPELDEFLDDFHPDIILHSMEGYIHLNRLIEYSVLRTGAKAIGYIWDDNFTYDQSTGLGFYMYRFFQRRSLRSLARLTSSFFAISPKTKKEADSFFHVSCKVLTKPANIGNNVGCLPIKQEEVTRPLRMLYTGNLNIGRDDSLMFVAQTLKEINKENLKLELDVYTNTALPDAYVNEFNSEYCHIHPPIPQNEVLKLQQKADILLFLEALSGKNAKTARLSFSTKITDYLSSGKCIFAVGNMDVAPIQYFVDNDSAVVAASRKEVFNQLRLLAKERSLIAKYANNALRCAKENHNPSCIKDLFFKTIREAIEK